MAQITTIQVQFGRPTGGVDGVDAHLSAEIDDRPAGLNGGDTSFEPGDTAWFFVFKSTNVQIDSITASAGSLGSGGSVIVERSEDVTFAGVNEGSLNVPGSGITSYEWLGNNLGSLSLGANGQTVTASAKGVAIARINYLAPATTHSITSPLELGTATDFPILVVVVGSVTA
jgi:hypothetical protein